MSRTSDRGTTSDTRATGRSRLRVDPVACDGVGICAHVAPGLVSVDAWGYPILSSAPLDRRGTRRAEVAVAACPRRALFVERPGDEGR